MEISHFVAYFHIFIYFPQQKSEFSSKIQAMLRSQRSLRLGIRWLVVSGLGLHTLYPIPCTIIIHNLYISNCYQHGQKCGPGVRLVPSNETQFFAIKLTDLLGKPNGQPPLSPVSNVLTRPHVLHWNLLAVWGLSAALEFYQIYHIHQDFISLFIMCLFHRVSPCPCKHVALSQRQQHLFWPCRHWSPSWTSCHPDPAPKKNLPRWWNCTQYWKRCR